MKKTLLNSLLLLAIITVSSLSGEVYAQENKISGGKRNSPFSPNPKKKPETAHSTEELRNGSNAINAEIPVDNQISGTKNGNSKPVQIASALSKSDEQPEFQNADFESRSAAGKTLEVVKKAVSLPPTETYKVGVGDVLFISLQNAPAKESTYFTVLKDGTIDYPLAGEMIQAAGATTEEIESVLAGKIKLYENPQVSVKIREHNSHSYTVLGLAEKPGEKYMQREAIPLYVVRAEAIAQGKANRAIIKRANSQTETVDLRDSKYEEVLIFSGDFVEFATEENSETISVQQRFFYIGGAVREGGQKDFHKGMTLTQAILASGGLRKSSIQFAVIRRKNEAGFLVPTAYDLRAIKDGKAADPVLEAGDTIEVGN